MILLLQVLLFNLALAAASVFVVWILIGRKGFIGLEQTDSRLARVFLGKHRPAGART